jgi:hypothetical protein
MMRVDPQDRADIVFLVGQSSLSARNLDELASSARIPPITEIREAFERNLEWLGELLRRDQP